MSIKIQTRYRTKTFHESLVHPSSHFHLWHPPISLSRSTSFPVVSTFILIVATSPVCDLPILEYAKVVCCPTPSFSVMLVDSV